MPRFLPARSRSLATCTASSRVGATASACGLPAGIEAKASSRGDTTPCRMGMPKPRVLPVPVLAWPMMSCPDRATGRVIAWMGKGLVMLCSASASTISGWIGKSEKEGAGAACASGAVVLVTSVNGVISSGRRARARPRKAAGRSEVFGERAAPAGPGSRHVRETVFVPTGHRGQRPLYR
jgi:hypothetical protein